MRTLVSRTLGLVFCLSFSACGSAIDAYCGKGKECSIKAGTAFSETQCKTQNTTSREQAQTLGCGAEWDTLAQCYAGVDCAFTDQQIAAECGGKLSVFNKCVQR